MDRNSNEPQPEGIRQASLIIQAMEEASMSQADLARKAKLPPYTVSRLISGRNIAGMKSARALENALGFPIYTLGKYSSTDAEGSKANLSSIRSLGDGREEVQLRFIADPLSRMTIEVIINCNAQMTYQKFSKIVSILADDNIQGSS